MFCALYESRGGQHGAKAQYRKSVLNQASVMFWLGYLYKKIAQNSCEQQVRLINDKGFRAYRQEQRALAIQIGSEVTREARRFR